MTTLTELHIGDSLHSIELGPVTRLDLIKYAGASGDFNPIHTIDEEAINAGLPGIIAHGMWTMGNLAKIFSNLYEIGYIEEYKIRFKGMVFLNDVITLQADLKEKKEDKYYFNVAAINQSGKEAISGEVIFRTY
ncbi:MULTISPECIES: MaoC/PaaZ C-terminal domain-containing protein [unclassified Peribacillus]|uniref:MaoC/PaaZ C-terminal domain-containing protein n=1 Tax=unclassified Peribacillus TaxID=2675266 RepID=UPI0006F3AE01|nr:MULTISPECIES: MaoC/PaaZ C-terminal domain-containing protein [unclassified Peribacillus]KQU14747.1 dehydratase [Bacillus sp. Leaf13]MBK5458646.1 dehydratase [Peribacillus sp. TH27]MBK5480551.1 dehydratase [Peribacillus sp. TH16]MBK5502058.1 dehydratase [Peribacillus sp. TH14]MBK5446635.1 dehydratase [Peribacillus sp. TH24]